MNLDCTDGDDTASRDVHHWEPEDRVEFSPPWISWKILNLFYKLKKILFKIFEQISEDFSSRLCLALKIFSKFQILIVVTLKTWLVKFLLVFYFLSCLWIESLLVWVLIIFKLNPMNALDGDCKEFLNLTTFSEFSSSVPSLNKVFTECIVYAHQ